jgi:uncharacterized membrane protein YfcA
VARVGELEALFLAAAAAVAGAINAVAGGGSLISFPALIAAGFDPVPANVTNTVALWPGYVAGSWAYRPELARQSGRAVRLAPACIAGAGAGSVLLLATPPEAFEAIVPFLIYGACAAMLLQRRLRSAAERHRFRGGGRRAATALHVSVFVLAVYGAYFGAGLGIVLLAVLLVLLPDDIQRANALKGLLSAVINSVAAVWFAVFGPVSWTAAAAMAAGSLLGGYGGVGIARRLGAERLRWAVILYGAAVGSLLLVRAAQA